MGLALRKPSVCDRKLGNQSTRALYVTYLACLVIALLPLSRSGFVYEIGVVTFYPYTLAVTVMIPFALLRVVVKKRGLQMIGLLEGFIVALGLAFLSSTLLSDVLLESGRLAFHALFIPFSTYFIVRTVLITEKAYTLGIRSLLIPLFAFCAATIVIYMTQQTRPSVLEIPPIGVATLVIVVLLHSILGSWKSAAARGITFLVSAAALITTLSRVYILLALLIPFIAFALRRKPILTWVGTLAGTLLLTLLFTYIEKPNYSVLTDPESTRTFERLYQFEHYYRALIGRAVVYTEALRDFWNNPLFGTGIRAGEYQITPHNFHVEWLQYGGLLGYSLYSGVLIIHILRVAPFIYSDRQMLAHNATLFTVILNSLTNGFMHGMMPYVAFVLMGFSMARAECLKATRGDLSFPQSRAPLQKPLPPPIGS